MTGELFRGKEKKQKNAQKCGKKKIQHIFIKKIGGSSKSEWMADELFRGKKKYILFFFSDQKYDFGKKNTIFWFEWMNGLWTYPRKKKYGTFDS